MKRNAIIEQLIFDNIMESTPLSEEYQKLLDEVIENDDELRKKLKNAPELLELYKKTERSLNFLGCKMSNMYFYEAFRFGVLLGLDIADTKKPPIEEKD